MSTLNILALDVGTTSMRGLLFSQDGKVLASAVRATEPIYNGQYIEQDPDVYSNSLLSICRQIALDWHVDAISLTAFRSAPMLVDESGKPLTRFIMWQDTRNREICEALSHHSPFVHQRSGAAINTVFTASKISWFRDHMPKAYQKSYKSLVVPDYLILLMTGRFVTDYTYGSRTSLMNIHTLSWDEELCRIFGVDPEKLCTLISQGTVAGILTEQFAQASGLRPGLPVISAGGDQQCGALGLGVLDQSSLEVNSGTGSYIISVIDAPYLEDSSLVCNIAAIPGKYTLESGVLASASAQHWLMQNFWPDQQKGESGYEAFNALAAASPPGANGLRCLPHFQGCGTRRWDPGARAGFFGLSFSHTRADLARSLYEGICSEIAKSVDALPSVCRQAGQVRIAGGLSQSEVFVQILCDMLERPLLKASSAQATAVGAFISAGVVLGLFASYEEGFATVRDRENPAIYNPDPALAELYRSMRNETEFLFDSLRALRI